MSLRGQFDRIKNNPTVRKETREWFNAIVTALILTFFLRMFVVQAFKIPSGSMIPTLEIGDKLFVSKLSYRFGDPERGDIVVFKYPGDPNNPFEPKSEKKKDFIKRLVAFEGEVVQIKEGKIYIDGKVLDDPETFGKFFYYNFEPYGGAASKVKVPEGSYFVLGDNSASSRDSRFWGFVPKKNMIGKAVFRWWPLRRIGTMQ